MKTVTSKTYLRYHLFWVGLFLAATTCGISVCLDPNNSDTKAFWFLILTVMNFVWALRECYFIIRFLFLVLNMCDKLTVLHNDPDLGLYTKIGDRYERL